MAPKTIDLARLRAEVVGADATIETPFGERLMVYADYTASGRCVGAIERYIQELQRIYANTHTEDDISGRTMSQLLEQAETAIKQSVNAGSEGRIICVGTGATGAIDKLQQILGVAIPPATRAMLNNILQESLGEDARARFSEYLDAHQPVVFVGPYEHHSNEISWRESLATIVEVNLDDDGGIDIDHLESLLQDPAFRNRKRIGSFSAASNVTGRITPVHKIAALLHRYDAIACFDYAASAPYVQIDMNPAQAELAGDPSLDAVFLSPHKFLGGPGSSGVLVFNERLYQKQLPPTVSAGGTVDYVGFKGQDFFTDVEEREKAGTPGVLQTLKAGLVFQLKDRIGVAAIEVREHELLQRSLARCNANPHLEILGDPDPAKRIAIISFNVRDPRGRYLHPKFVTTLLNDLFGIQSRAGCSCAGPYGHRLLDIDHDASERYRSMVRKGYSGIKPGWCRISLHYVMDDLEVDYILNAIDFVAARGYRFLPLYSFDLYTGAWTHKDSIASKEKLSIDEALEGNGNQRRLENHTRRAAIYKSCISEATRLADEIGTECGLDEFELVTEIDQLAYFSIPRDSIESR